MMNSHFVNRSWNTCQETFQGPLQRIPDVRCVAEGWSWWWWGCGVWDKWKRRRRCLFQRCQIWHQVCSWTVLVWLKHSVCSSTLCILALTRNWDSRWSLPWTEGKVPLSQKYLNHTRPFVKFISTWCGVGVLSGLNSCDAKRLFFSTPGMF